MPELLEKPRRVTLELTSTCNLSCPRCPRHYMKYPKGFMEESLFMGLVDEIADAGISVLVPFFRGESLLHPAFMKLMSHAKARGMAVQLATNGTLMNGKTATALVEMGFDFISFSVDSIDETTYRMMRSGSDLSDLIRIIDFLLNEKERLKSSLPEVQVSAVDTGLEEETLSRFVSHWSAKVQRVRIYPQHTRAGEFGSLDNAPLIPRKPCHKPFTEMVIYWDGKAALCNHDWDRSEPLGDASTAGIMAVWKSDAYRLIRQKHLDYSFDEADVCRTCGHWAQYYEKEGLIGTLYASDEEYPS